MAQDDIHKMKKLLSRLVQEVDIKNRELRELQRKFDEMSISYSLAKEEKEKLNLAHKEELRRNLKSELELESITKELKAHKQKMRSDDIGDCSWGDKLNDKEPKATDHLEMEELLKKVSTEMEEKNSEIEHLENLNQVLVMKERNSNNEINEARKEIIMAMKDMHTNQSTIFIKRMGELDEKPFQKACKERFPSGDSDVKAIEFCSKWEDELKDPNWHPYKSIDVNGKHLEIIDKNDRKLEALFHNWGEEVYNAVTAALLELNEYNPSGRYPVHAIWNRAYEREATMKEIVEFLLKLCKTNKRKR